MNHIYMVIWSKVKHCYVVTSEVAKKRGTKASSTGIKSMMAAVFVAAILTGRGGLPVEAAENGKQDIIKANAEIELLLDVLATGNGTTEYTESGSVVESILPTNQHIVYDENGFYVKQSTEKTYNSLTKDGLWVGGYSNNTGLHVDNEGNLTTTGTVTAFSTTGGV